VSLNKGTTSVLVGKTETLVATVGPLNATNQAVTWSSDKPGIATVSQSGGVKGIAAGEATITVKTADVGWTATCTVTVALTAVPVTGVSLAPPVPTTLAVGNTALLTAVVVPANATNQAVTWYSSNPAVAYVSQSGEVKGMAGGEAIIEARSVGDPAKTASGTITVTLTGQPPSQATDLTAYIAAPAASAKPTLSFDTSHYSGTVIWSPNPAHDGEVLDPSTGGFWTGTVYTAVVLLTAKTGYTFTGTGTFIHDGAASSASSENTGGTVTVTIVFLPTGDSSGTAGGKRPEM
jgi:hypothetical protein